MADSLYNLSLNIIKSSLTENHPYYLGSLINLAVFYGQIRRFTKADSIFKQAIDICKRTVGENSTQYALILRSQGKIFYYMGNYKEAESFFLQAISIGKNVAGETHPDYATALLYQSELLITKSDFANAEPYILSTLALEKSLLLNKLDFLSETELLPYLKEKESTFALPYASLLHHQSSSLINAAYNSCIVVKGVSLQNTNRLFNQIEQSKDSLMLNIWKEYKTNKALLNKTLGLVKAKRNINTDSLSNITNQQEKKLLRNFADYRNRDNGHRL